MHTLTDTGKFASCATIQLNTFRDAKTKNPISDSPSWSGFCNMLRRLANTSVGKAPPKNKGEAKLLKALLPAFNTAILSRPYNQDDNVESLTALPIDVDRGSYIESIERLAEANIAALFYTSPSHPNADGTDRFRVVVPLDQPLAPGDVKHARKALAELLGIGPGQGVERADAVSQVFFIGRFRGTPKRDFDVIDGDPVSTAALVSAKLTHAWPKPAAAKKVKALDRVGIEDPDERTAALLEALAPHWEAPGQAEGRRQVLRALGGYLARRGWSDEQIAALGAGLETERPEEDRIALMLECAQSTRACDGETGAGWSGLVEWSAEAAAVIESIAKDPLEPEGFAGCWDSWWAACYAREGSWVNRPRERREAKATGDGGPGGEEFAPPANDTDETVTPQSDEQRTDLGNARRLVRGYGDSIRYFGARGLWYVWDGARWKADDTGEIMRAAKDAAESLWLEARAIGDDDKRKAAFAWAAKCQERQRLANMIELAKSEPGIPVLASELDAHPWLLNVQNGTLDLRTGELSDPDPALLMTKCCATHYDPNARSALWNAFVGRTTGGDAELAAYVQRSLGYALFGAWREKAFWFGYGPPDGAKSTLLGAIGDVLGDYHVAAAASTWMVQNNVGGNRGDVTRLLGARFVTSLEIRPGLRFDEELVKKVTGGDAIVAAGKYENEIQFPPTFALWMGANDRPTIRDDDEGMWSRMRCVPFTNPVPDDEKDPHLKEKLTSAEHAPAVLAWLVAGCLAWQREGLGKCSAVTAATNAYRADMNRAGTFFEDCCELGDGYETSAKAMRRAYDEWCKANGVRSPLAANALGQRLRALGATGGDDASRRTVVEAKPAFGTYAATPAVKDRFWSGVRLRADSD